MSLPEDRPAGFRRARARLHSGPPLCRAEEPQAVYLESYRNEGAFHEAVTNRILDDLAAATAPRFMRLTARFYVRRRDLHHRSRRAPSAGLGARTAGGPGPLPGGVEHRRQLVSPRGKTHLPRRTRRKPSGPSSAFDGSDVRSGVLALPVALMPRATGTPGCSSCSFVSFVVDAFRFFWHCRLHGEASGASRGVLTELPKTAWRPRSSPRRPTGSSAWPRSARK